MSCLVIFGFVESGDYHPRWRVHAPYTSMSAADYLKLFMLMGIAVGLVLNRRLAHSSVVLRLENERYVEETDRMFGVED